MNDSVDDFVLVHKSIPYSKDEEIFARNALETLLQGPDEKDRERGFTPLIRPGRLIDLKIRHGTATVNFSKKIAPAGGSTAVWHVRMAVQELLRQFPGIKKVQIQIEGVPEDIALQP